MTRTELINYIIKKQGYTSYLEIGIGTGRNFDKIICKRKVGVDPNTEILCMVNKTSDDFFDQNKKVTKTKVGDFTGYSQTFDCVFIDGLHESDQVRRDIINSWECLTDGGCLVIHDTNPDREEITHVPRDSKEWTGDVYKAIHQVDGPPKFTLQDDHGVTVIRKTGPLVMSDGVIEWEGFDLFRQQILNLVTADEAIKIVDSWT